MLTRAEYHEWYTWQQNAWQSAQAARKTLDPRWERYYRLYRSYVKPRKRGDWRSRVFMPESFQTVETILPHLVAQLPHFMVRPFGAEDAAPAEIMEKILDHRMDSSGVHEELIDAMRNALVLGTGIIKTFWDTRTEYKRAMKPAFQTTQHVSRVPLVDPDTKQPMRDESGQPMFEEQTYDVQVPIGMRSQRETYVCYDGPMGINIDPMNFWVSPEAEDIDSARYAIHRSYQDWDEVMKWVEDGTYTLPEGFSVDDFLKGNPSFPDDPHQSRMADISLGYQSDPTRKQVEIRETWTKDGLLITVADGRLLLRVTENPFDHGQKPFIPIYDYKMPHEFWGVGEIEIIEGLQDLINAITNQRIDNVRMGMDQMYAVNKHQLVNPSQLQKKPGGIVEIQADGMNPNEVIFPLPTTEVTSSAFAEADQAKMWSERASAVSAYQRGEMSPSLSDTATGIATLMEAGASRFNLKAIYMNLHSFRKMGKHFGSMLQQFTTQESFVRTMGPDGSVNFEQVSPSQMMGAFDFCIEPSSITQSETIKKEQALGLLRELAPILVQGPVSPAVRLLIEDILETHGFTQKEKMMQAIDQGDQQAMAQMMEQMPQ